MNGETWGPQDSTIINPEEGKVRSSGALGRRALLLTLSESQFGTTFVLDGARVRVGRSSGCDVVLDDPLVSREHCVIERDEEGLYWLEDLGSKNATVLNRKSLTRRAQLFYGDRLVLGNTVLRFFLEERVDRR
jgi:pSer/pThr/pTyr-binding forkhead associated (FHA) protein